MEISIPAGLRSQTPINPDDVEATGGDLIPLFRRDGGEVHNSPVFSA
jgi:hypothetical protein